ncbi:Site-specific DNA recombinase [Seinonella peptonophila]|uniref:Site-specific DNA recombinase n=1 Tax=Seinonella peptonophila TaxID=112248 RepID=A0A1M4T7K9_9BACL|nr:recombinase family protein [Seinonella peptonophila]SHE40390.1 Site-specific DNA recombinase [Seinonella peptonophila]
MDKVAIYLRKSRADLDAEARGEGETLEKHRKILNELAKERGYNIVVTFEEIASGESIHHRPEMLKLLNNVENGLYDAILVMDIDRLGRGNMQDQGLILDTFKESNTKIITPRKIYDLDNEFDEEYSEFEAFMARKEFKIIKRRLHQGRLRSVKDGNYVGARPPYGYTKVKVDGNHTLEPEPEQAKIVNLIFEWYTSDNPNVRSGTTNIAKRLNEMGVPSYYGGKWSNNVILQIVRNPVYIGKISWGRVERKKSKAPHKGVEARIRPVSEQILVDGNHPAIVSEKLFYKAQDIRTKKSHPRYKPNQSLQNPLAGLIVCSICGGNLKMFRQWGRKNRHRHLRCDHKGRGGHCNRTVRLRYVENRIIKELEHWIHQYEEQITFTDDDFHRQEPAHNHLEIYEITIKSLTEEIEQLQSQKDRLHDFLERGIYDEDTFLSRSIRLKERIEENQLKLDSVIAEQQQELKRQETKLQFIPKVKQILDVYEELDVEERNILLKEIIDKCVYLKEQHQKNDEFSLTIHVKI